MTRSLRLSPRFHTYCVIAALAGATATSGATPPACPSSRLTAALPAKVSFSGNVTISALGLQSKPSGGLYCCSQSYLTLQLDNSGAPGATVATSSIVTLSQYDTWGERYYSFSPAYQIPAGTALWVSFNVGPSTTTNGTELASFVDFQFTCNANLGSAGPTNRAGFTNEPINTATGNYLQSTTDLAVPSKGIPFAFTRSYNSADGYSGPLGSGWTHSYNLFLTVAASGIVTIKEPDGHEDSFAPVGAGAYNSATPGLFDSLTQNTDGTFTLTRKTQIKLSFSSTGKLMSIADRNGNTVALAYNGSGNLTTVTDGTGRVFTLAYDGSGRISSLSDPAARSWSYGYDANGNLKSVRDATGAVTQYGYDASHRMTSASDARGVTFLQNAYDGLGRVTAQSNGRLFSTTLSYNTPSVGTTTITDPLGNATQHVYDTNLRLVSVIDAKGGTRAYAYDANNNQTSLTNQNGGVTTLSYDHRGNVVGVSDPFGNSTALAFSATNDLLSTTNPKGNTTTFSYDGRGNLTQVRDAAGGVASFAYDGSGLLLSKIDARGNTGSFTYDSFGDAVTSTTPSGGVTLFSYDGVGRVTAVTDPNGHTRHSTYDAVNRLLTQSDALNDTVQLAYDAIGNRVKVTDANGNATNYAYDATNNLTTVTDALGHATGYAYDGNDNRLSLTNANGKITTFAYDSLNRLTKTTDPLSLSTLYTYDAVGNITATTDAKGWVNRYGYDALNRMISGTYADGSSVAYAFDKDGKRSSMVDSHGTTTYSYDALDRLLTVAGPTGTTRYAYDAVGNRTSLTYPNGKAVQYQYDPSNRLSRVSDWASKATTYIYDASRNMTAQVYSNGAVSSYVYDAANRLTRLVNTVGIQVASSFTYSLDKVGNRLQVTSASGGVTKYGYDVLNRLTSWTVPSGQVTQYAYDAVGNRLSLASSAGTTAYTYDDADQMLTGGASTFQYDANGNQTAKTTGSSTAAYSFDPLNRLVSAIGGTINSHYQYDGDGNRVSQTILTGTYQYQNDTASSLPAVLSEAGPDGNVDYLYGPSLISDTGSAFQYFFQPDGLGSAASLSDSTGALKGTYSFDPWGKLLTPLDPLGTKNKYKFTGEALDPGTGLYFLRARYYDPITGRFLSRDPKAGSALIPASLNRYSYALSNPVGLRDPSGESAIDSEAVGQNSSSGTDSAASFAASYVSQVTNPLFAYTTVGPAVSSLLEGAGAYLSMPGLVTAGLDATPVATAAAFGFTFGRIIGSIPTVRSAVSNTLFNALTFTFGTPRVAQWSTSPIWDSVSAFSNALAITY